MKKNHECFYPSHVWSFSRLVTAGLFAGLNDFRDLIEGVILEYPSCVLEFRVFYYDVYLRQHFHANSPRMLNPIALFRHARH